VASFLEGHGFPDYFKMSGIPHSLYNTLPVLSAPQPGEAWGCLDLPGALSHRLETRGSSEASALPPEEGIAFYLNDFKLTDPQPWHVPSVLGRSGPVSALGTPAAVWEEPGRDAFLSVFNDAMLAIRQRRLLKVVPAANAVAQLECSPGPALHGLLHPTRTAGRGHAVGWSDGRQGFAAITPEVLFELSGTRLTTMALAGTADAQHEADLRKGPKLAREHEIVVDELHRRLASLGRVSLTAREIVPLGTVRHLRTTLTVDLPEAPSGAALNDLIQLLHPTPALGISPRNPDTLTQLNGYRNRCGVPAYFGAPFGAVWPGGAVFLVAIRGLFWRDLELELPVGCGLVAGSVFETEWAELELKRHWVRNAFELDAVHA
jgi:menaquinone-specific isochorismate synthase